MIDPCNPLDSYYLRKEMGDRIHTVLYAPGRSIQWLIRMILKKGVFPSMCLDLCTPAVGTFRPIMDKALGGRNSGYYEVKMNIFGVLQCSD
jgi:hypothetical protein